MTKSYEIIERTGVSTESVEEAIKQALNEAKQEKPIAWFETVEIRGRITQDEKVEFQVTLKIGRKLN
jgi:flavin-binding protein dodecin